jgi:hypothetical protein
LANPISPGHLVVYLHALFRRLHSIHRLVRMNTPAPHWCQTYLPCPNTHKSFPQDPSYGLYFDRCSRSQRFLFRAKTECLIPETEAMLGH